MTLVALSDVCEIRRGTTITQRQTREGDVPVVAGGIEPSYFHDTANRPANVVSVSGSGANAGYVNFWDRPIFASDCSTVEPRGEDIDIRYVYYFLRSKQEQINSLRSGAAQPHVYPRDIAPLQIPLLLLDEQRRIVDLLSRAEGIVRLRREAQRKAAELVPALFLDMFGDPASNPKGWPVVALGDYLSIQSSVRTPDLVVDAHLPCIGADSIESATGRIVSWPTVDEIRPISGKYSFDESDVLYSKIRPALRKAIIAPSNGYCSADMYPLRPNELATAEFVVSLLLSKDFTDYAVGVSMRAQMPKVNRETLFAYKAPLPPIELQRDFAAKVDAVRGIAAQQAAALATAKATFDALLHQSFAVS